MITVREYAKLTTAFGYNEGLEIRTIPQSAFDWFLEQQASHFVNGQPLIHIDGSHAIKLESFVGVISTPCGTQIEILPKTHLSTPNNTEIKKLRHLLVDMIKTSFKLQPRQYDRADLILFSYPLPEWMIAVFIEELVILTRKGLRFDYIRIEEENKFLRGALDINRQIRQPISKAHIFNIRHDIYSPDRPANRVLKKALEICVNSSKEPTNWRKANELLHFLDEIPTSIDVEQDIKSWASDSLMADYNTIKPWAELIVRNLIPLSQKGVHEGLSLLFPMEYLFEQYVAFHLENQLPTGWKLKTQAQSKFLCMHEDRNFFQLRPDLLAVSTDKGKVIAMDTKWKLLDQTAGNGTDKYGLSQADFYQLYAYGQKYMNGEGEMTLIYPKYEKFTEPLPVFDFGADLKLWVVPFDLDKKKIVYSEEKFSFRRKLST